MAYVLMFLFLACLFGAFVGAVAAVFGGGRKLLRRLRPKGKPAGEM